MMLHGLSGGYAETLVAAQLKLLGDLDYSSAASAVRAPLVPAKANASEGDSDRNQVGVGSHRGVLPGWILP